MSDITKIRIENYGAWVITNLIIPIIILSIIIFFPNFSKAQLFSGYLAYFLALLILSLYVFRSYFKTDIEQFIFTELLSTLTLLFIVIIFAIYFLYNLREDILEEINRHMLIVTAGLGLITFIFALLLHAPTLNWQILQESERRKQKNREKIKQEVNKIGQELKQEKQ